MHVLEVGVEALDLGVEHVLGHIKVDGDHRKIPQKHGLGLVKETVTLVNIPLLVGASDQRVVPGIGVTRAIVPPSRHPHVEKGVGVHIISDPGRPRDVVIEEAHRVEVGPPLLVLEADGKAQVFAPLGLEHFGDVLVQLICVVENADHRRLFHPEVRKSLLEECLGPGEIIAGELRALVGADAGWDEMEGGLLVVAGHLVHDGPAVHREGQGESHPWIPEKFAFDRVLVLEVDAVEVHPKVRSRMEVLALSQFR